MLLHQGLHTFDVVLILTLADASNHTYSTASANETHVMVKLTREVHKRQVIHTLAGNVDRYAIGGERERSRVVCDTA
jgi:hypothetical protein